MNSDANSNSSTLHSTSVWYNWSRENLYGLELPNC